MKRSKKKRVKRTPSLFNARVPQITFLDRIRLFVVPMITKTVEGHIIKLKIDKYGTIYIFDMKRAI